jgi:hypothetical protein
MSNCRLAQTKGRNLCFRAEQEDTVPTRFVIPEDRTEWRPLCPGCTFYQRERCGVRTLFALCRQTPPRDGDIVQIDDPRGPVWSIWTKGIASDYPARDCSGHVARIVTIIAMEMM